MKETFLEKFAAQHKKVFTGFSREAMTAILNYPWTGNVRELENVIERIVVLHDGPTVTLAHIPSNVVHHTQPLGPSREAAESSAAQNDTVLPLNQIIKDAIRKAIEASNGDISQAAKKLDLPEETVREKAERYGLGMAW